MARKQKRRKNREASSSGQYAHDIATVLVTTANNLLKVSKFYIGHVERFSKAQTNEASAADKAKKKRA
jgi:hypothetical protein